MTFCSVVYITSYVLLKCATRLGTAYCKLARNGLK